MKIRKVQREVVAERQRGGLLKHYTRLPGPNSLTCPLVAHMSGENAVGLKARFRCSSKAARIPRLGRTPQGELMPDRLGSSSDAGAPLTVVVFPGLSLMDIEHLAVGIALVRCPGCGATMVLTTDSAQTGSHRTFVHEADDCPVLVRIENVLAAIRDWTGDGEV